MKEVTTTVIAVGIILLNGVMFYKVISSGTFYDQAGLQKLIDAGPTAKDTAELIRQVSDAQFDQLKEVLLIATGFLGIILGYYFGRVPAEKAQESAEKQAKDAQDKADGATKEAATATAQMKQAELDKQRTVEHVSGELSRIEGHWRTATAKLGTAPAKVNADTEMVQLESAMKSARAVVDNAQR